MNVTLRCLESVPSVDSCAFTAFSNVRKCIKRCTALPVAAQTDIWHDDGAPFTLFSVTHGSDDGEPRLI